MTVPVHLSSHLRSYTKGRSDVEAEGTTLADLVTDMDRRFPGIRFRMIDEQDRIRPHLNVWVGGTFTRDLATPIPSGNEVAILGALSGG
jgi:molybdopterin synthase sulfur carrier subunit